MPLRPDSFPLPGPGPLPVPGATPAPGPTVVREPAAASEPAATPVATPVVPVPSPLAMPPAIVGPAPPEPIRATKTYLLVDGENIDATLGMNVLGRRPNPEERPRWDRIRGFAEGVWGQTVVPLFFLNTSSGQMPLPFIQALLAMDYRPIPLSGATTEKVVDIGIQRTLDAIAKRHGDVLLASHDGDFHPQIEALLGDGRRVGVLAFREFLNGQFADLTERGLATFDLEADAQAFTAPLPRVRIIPLEEFDPEQYL